MYSTRESNNKVSTCPCTVGTGDQKYDELKWESSIISAIEKQHTSKHPAAVRRSDSRKPDLALSDLIRCAQDSAWALATNCSGKPCSTNGPAKGFVPMYWHALCKVCLLVWSRFEVFA